VRDGADELRLHRAREADVFEQSAFRSTIVACCAMPVRNCATRARSASVERREADREEAGETLVAVERCEDHGRQAASAREETWRPLGVLVPVRTTTGSLTRRPTGDQPRIGNSSRPSSLDAASVSVTATRRNVPCSTSTRKVPVQSAASCARVGRVHAVEQLGRVERRAERARDVEERRRRACLGDELLVALLEPRGEPGQRRCSSA
jgi:hypothetical protein